jgi:hypothetical protein
LQLTAVGTSSPVMEIERNINTELKKL